MSKMVIQTGKRLFKLRGYTPIPFLIVCLFFFSFESKIFLTGLSLIGLGEIIRLYAVGYVGKSSRNTNLAGGEKLVVNGPYLFVRNPIYIGNILIYLGFAVLSNVFFPLWPLVTLVFFVFAYHLIVRYEEARLRELFGVQYENFIRHVPRFLPRTTPFLDADYSDRFDLKKALQSEKATLGALLAVMVLFGIRYYTL